jgi:hypothetical protein
MIKFIGHLYSWLYNSYQIADALSSSSDWTLHGNYSDFQLNWTELNCRLASRYIVSGRTTSQKHICCLAMDTCETAQKTALATPLLLLCACIVGFIQKRVYSLAGWIFVAGLFTESFPSNGSTYHIMYKWMKSHLDRIWMVGRIVVHIWHAGIQPSLSVTDESEDSSSRDRDLLSGPQQT